MQGEILFLVLGLIALVLWSPAIVGAAWASRSLYRRLRSRGTRESWARWSAVVVCIAILIAYTPLYVVVLLLLFDWGVIPSGG